MSFVIADLSPLVDVVLKVTVLLAIAAIAARALARRSAAARHQVWAVAIAASLMMPVLAAVAPQWTIAVLPTPAATVDAPQAAAPAVAEVGGGSGVRAAPGNDTRRGRATRARAGTREQTLDAGRDLARSACCWSWRASRSAPRASGGSHGARLRQRCGLRSASGSRSHSVFNGR